MSWAKVFDVLGLIRHRCTVLDLTARIHERALQLASRHPLGWHDALLVSAALDAGCKARTCTPTSSSTIR